VIHPFIEGVESYEMRRYSAHNTQDLAKSPSSTPLEGGELRCGKEVSDTFITQRKPVPSKTNQQGFLDIHWVQEQAPQSKVNLDHMHRSRLEMARRRLFRLSYNFLMAPDTLMQGRQNWQKKDEPTVNRNFAFLRPGMERAR
jgi:hypothetical protein